MFIAAHLLPKIKTEENVDKSYLDDDSEEIVRNEAISAFNEKLGKFGLKSFQHRFVNKSSILLIN